MYTYMHIHEDLQKTEYACLKKTFHSHTTRNGPGENIFIWLLHSDIFLRPAIEKRLGEAAGRRLEKNLIFL